MSDDPRDPDESGKLATIIEAMRPFDACFARLKQFRTMLRDMGIPDPEIARLGRLAMDFIEAGLEPPSSEALLISLMEPGRGPDYESPELREALVVADKGPQERAEKLSRARSKINRAKDEADAWVGDAKRIQAEEAGVVLSIARGRPRTH